MAKAVKEKDSRQFIKRKSYLKKIARGNGSRRASAEYLKYGDIPKSDVYEGTATYRSGSYDPNSVTKEIYSVAVARGHGKGHFRHRGKLYSHNKSSGGSIVEIQV